MEIKRHPSKYVVREYEGILSVAYYYAKRYR
jgi:hypothetical protein